MTNGDRDKREDDALEALVADALSARGDLMPTTEEQVARAERDGVELEVELPDELRELGEPARRAEQNVVQLEDRRRSPTSRWLGHAAAGVLGAAAASVFWIWFRSPPDEIRPTPAAEPNPPAASSSASVRPVEIGPVRACPPPCCAGKACEAAEPLLRSCSSGRACIPCALDHLHGSLYRLRVGSLALSVDGQQRRDGERWGSLEVCARVGSAEPACIAAHAGAASDEVWTSLPGVASAQDLAAGFDLTIRVKGARTPLASWKHAVVVNPTLLCRGLSVAPKTTTGETLGTLSVFLEDAHYVELARSSKVSPLVERQRGLTFADVVPEVYETREAGERRYVLAAGPLDKPTAERLRWKLLDRELDATLGTGVDWVGQPRVEAP